MVKLTINNRDVEAQEGQTILDVLKAEGVKVPTLCHVKNLVPTGACRMCVVELEGARGLVPACAYPINNGMKIQTHSARVIKARKTIIELLLSNHPDDCLYCVRNTNCELQTLAEQHGVRDRRYTGVKNNHHVDASSPSVVRDPAKCILCGRCVRVCEEIQNVACIDFIGRGADTVIGTTFNEGLNTSTCINCGQCVVACPTGALHEQSHIKEVVAALDDPGKVVVCQHAPSISVTLAEEFGMKPGVDVDGIMTAALRRMGFDRVFDTSFSADLTIMEEGSELVHRLTKGGKIPMMTSCSPGWIKYVEQFYPEFRENVSSCKSPQQMLGAVIKSYFAENQKINPKEIYSVSIMPCTAKKFEAERPEMARNGIPDVDAVLTTRELAQLIRLRGVDMMALDPEGPDTPFGTRSTAGKIFGASGGVMEAALRSAYFLITGEELSDLNVKAVRGFDGIKEAKVDIKGTTVGVAVASGLENAKTIMEQLRNGRDDLHFIEIMTCPGGCICGGGQPHTHNPEAARNRMKALYKLDRDEKLRTSHSNAGIQRLYKEFLGEPLGHKSHELLHTHYVDRTDVN